MTIINVEDGNDGHESPYDSCTVVLLEFSHGTHILMGLPENLP